MTKAGLRIGTSGFSYKDWRKTFYPPSIKPEDMFSFYCRHFNSLELNVSYYKIPERKIFERLAKLAPSNFDIIVKLNRQVTHTRSSLQGIIEPLLENSKPLMANGHFAGFLAQFPFSFRNTQINRAYLYQLAERLRAFSVFVEFRHDSWAKPAVNSFLQSINLGYINVDEPQLKGLLPKQDWLTTSNGYVRFHGRNKNAWWDGNAMERYRYQYQLDELKEWLNIINTIRGRAKKTYLFFNNHPGGGAPLNARQMKELLQK